MLEVPGAPTPKTVEAVTSKSTVDPAGSDAVYVVAVLWVSIVAWAVPLTTGVTW